MAGQSIFKTAHSCGSSDGLQVFEKENGEVNGWCFACETFVPDPLGEHTLESFPVKKRIRKTKEEIEAEIAEISTYPVEDLPDRRLRASSLDKFGVKLGFDEETGTTVRFHFYPYTKNGKLTSYKTRLVEEKKMWSVGDQTDVDLFGWEQAVATGAKRLIITEGELDAVALDRILEMHTPDKWKEYTPAVCSLPHGASAAGKDLARLATKIRRHFKEVSFCFDGDKPGEAATEEACKVFPEATTIVLPAKDANDCILKGKTKAAYKAAVFNKEKPKNTRLVWGELLFEEAKKPAEWGIPWPWDGLNDATRGIRWGETWYLGAPQKTGKSVTVDTLIAHFIKNLNLKVFAAKPEEPNVKTVKKVAGKIVGKIFDDPKIDFDEEAYDEACKIIGGNLALVNVYQNLEWDTLKGDIIAAANEGCRVAIIDPVTVLTNHLSAADANTELQKIAQEASILAMDYQLIIFITCHVRNPPAGEPLERGGKVLPGMFAGSRAMARSCNGMLALEGNRDPSLPEEERNLRKLVLLENRETGEVGEWGLYYNPVTGLFTEVRQC